MLAILLNAQMSNVNPVLIELEKNRLQAALDPAEVYVRDLRNEWQPT